MAIFEIEFNQTDLKRIFDAVKRIEMVSEYEIKTIMQRKCAEEQAQDIKLYIISQALSGGYAPYNPRYMLWKVTNYQQNVAYWMLSGELLKSITVFKHQYNMRWGSQYGYMAGIPSGLADRGDKSWLGTATTKRGRSVYIAQYAHWMEYGRNGQPARPLFRPATALYAGGGKWQRNGLAALNKIKYEWR